MPTHEDDRYRRINHAGYSPERTVQPGSQWDPLPKIALEAALAEQWAKENERNSAINDGFGCLELLTTQSGDIVDRLPRDPSKPRYITQRDAHVAASVIQWLGASCGMCFLMEAFERAGWSIQIQHPAPDPKEGSKP